MDEAKRKTKWGKYGIVKYVYPDEEATELKETINHFLATYFPQAKIEYFT